MAELQRKVQAHQQAQQARQILQAQQLHQLQVQRAQQSATALQNLLQSNDPQALREALALIELQRAQQAATTPPMHLERAYAAQLELAALQQQQRAAAVQQSPAYQRALQQQALALQAQHTAQQGQRQALAAQLEAGALRRERERDRELRERERTRPMSPDDARVRAAFENGPSSGYFPPISPPVDSATAAGWTTTLSPTAKVAAAAPPNSSEWPFGWNLPSAPGRQSSSGSSSSTRPASPPAITTSPPTSAPPAALGRFARARQDQAAAQAAVPGVSPLAALLSRRKATDDDALSIGPDTAANSPLSEHGHQGPMNGSTLGRTPKPRQWSTVSERVVASDSLFVKEPMSYLGGFERSAATRSASFSSYSREEAKNMAQQGAVPASYVIRQPYGPPGSIDEIGDKNFATRIRRKAGLNLGMLNRRTESAEV